MEEIKTKQNKKIYIWVFSILSITMSALALTFFVYRNFVGKFFGAMDKSWFDVMLIYFLIVLILAIIGLIKGIKQRKAGSRLSSILGIVLPIIAILFGLYSGFGVELTIILMTT